MPICGVAREGSLARFSPLNLARLYVGPKKRSETHSTASLRSRSLEESKSNRRLKENLGRRNSSGSRGRRPPVTLATPLAKHEAHDMTSLRARITPASATNTAA